MNLNLTRRSFIRMISYITFAFVILGTSLYLEFSQRSKYETQIENTYVRSLEDLGTYMNNITVTLYKGIYSGTPYQLSGLSAKLWREAGGAKAAMAQLPLSQLPLENTTKFLSQVGEYAMAISRKAAVNNKLDQEDYDRLNELYDYSKTITEQIYDIVNTVIKGNINIVKAIKQEGTDEENTPSVISGFKDIEEGFTDYPTLIYDGPFSDNIMEKNPVMTKDAPAVSREDAREAAAKISSLSSSEFADDTDLEGKLPSFCFTSKDSTINIDVSKQGGYAYFLQNSRAIGDSTIGYDEALSKAKEFLNKNGYKSMTESYYEIKNGICTINFAYKKDDITYYTDLIKVGIALDKGDVVWFDARGYIFNHADRPSISPSIPVDEAKKSVSTFLKIEKYKLAVIPSAGLLETFCYEFTCKGLDDEPVLVYVNAKNKIEEQILILEISDNGVLTQ